MPVQRNNLSWLYTTVGFCSLKFSLYLLLCPDSRRPQLDIVVCGGIVHFYLRKCSTAHPDAAILRIRVRIEPVRMCDYVRTERHAGRTGPAALPPNQPFPHKSVPEHTFHHAIDVLGTQRQSARRGTACSADHRAIRHSTPCRQVGDIGNLMYVKTYIMRRNQAH